MSTSPRLPIGNPQPYGVLYTSKPSTFAPAAINVDKLLTPDVQFVRVQWVDFANTIRFRVLPAPYFRKLLSDPSSRAGIQLTKVTFGLVGLVTVPGFSPVGEYLYVPDLSSWRVCTYAPGHASVMGWFQEKVPDPRTGLLAVDLCPRTLLARLVRYAGSPGIGARVDARS